MMNPETVTKLHWSLAPLGKLLADFRWPEGPFNPNASWRHEYTLGILPFNTQGIEAAAGGTFTLERKAANDAVVLTVARTEKVHPHEALETAARVECAADVLCSPRSWTVQTRTLDSQGKAMPGQDYHESGKVDGKRLVRDSGKRHVVKLDKDLTSNWSLFDAVQRLKLDEGVLTFDMLEDLDMVRRNQELRRVERIEVATQTGPIPLTGYRQIGEGILPTHYWVDGAGRLVFATGGLRVFVLKSSVMG